jgi:DNA invertase Pin-like site-specific DNA recombinase
VNRGGVVREDLTFSDRATSGARTDRPAYEQLMRLVSAKPSQLDAIVIEDLSRLSRSAADLFTIQRLFEFLEVRIIGVADGIDTFAKHSPITYGIKTLVASIYLNELRDKTLRGLEGRARAGLATGGVAFGYRLQKELGPHGKVRIANRNSAMSKRTSFAAFSPCILRRPRSPRALHERIIGPRERRSRQPSR